jgi:predicted RNA-binding protein YlqC (UPF0109 family)
VAHEPAAVFVTPIDKGEKIALQVRCAPNDVEALYGQNGRTAHAFRTLLHAVSHEETIYSLMLPKAPKEIEDPDRLTGRFADPVL